MFNKIYKKINGHLNNLNSILFNLMALYISSIAIKRRMLLLFPVQTFEYNYMHT